MTTNLTFRALERNESEIARLCPAFWEFWLRVYREDLGHLVEADIAGEMRKVVAIEMMIYWYLHRGFDIQLALCQDDIVGFLVYRVACHHVLEVKAIFVEPDYWNKKVAVGLLDSLKWPIRRVLFQSRTEAEPTELLKHTAERRREVARTETLITWEMEWQHGNP